MKVPTALLAALLVTSLVPGLLEAQRDAGRTEVSTPVESYGMVWLDAELETRARDLAERSAIAGDMLRDIEEKLATAEFTVTWGTPTQVAERTERASPGFARSLNFGWVAAKRTRRSWWEYVGPAHWAEWLVVGVDLKGLAQFHGRPVRLARKDREARRSDRLYRESLALIAHELIHLHSVVMADGDMRRMCADAEPGQAVADSCLERRLAPIRRDLSLVRTRPAARGSLASFGTL